MYILKVQLFTGKIVSSPDHGNHCDFQQIFMILPTFWTLPWYGNLLKSASNLLDTSMVWKFVEVNFQPFGHFHGVEIFGCITEIC